MVVKFLQAHLFSKSVCKLIAEFDLKFSLEMKLYILATHENINEF